jgi:hypothetical protein
MPQAFPGLLDTISLITSYEHRYVVPSFIRDTFFSAKEYSDSDVVRIDSRLGPRGLAPFVLPLEGQVVGRRIPFQETFLKAPIIAPARVITLREANVPGIGETPYNYKTPEQRIADLIAADTEDMDDEISRREEWMCCQCMFSGTIPINYRNKTSVTINYGFTNTTTLANPWSVTTTNPFNDLMAAQQGLNANGYDGSIAIFSPDSWNALWNNPNVQNAMKNFGGFIPISANVLGQTPPNGVTKAPNFLYPTLENWIYSGTYVARDTATPGTPKSYNYVPAGTVLIGSRSIANRMWYALVTQIEQTDGNFHSYSTDRVPKIECNVNKNFYMHTMTSRPVPVPVDLLSWTVLKGCA